MLGPGQVKILYLGTRVPFTRRYPGTRYFSQACQISGFRPEITGCFIALPALRLSRENLRQNHKIFGICFSDNIKIANKINWLKT